MIAIDRRTPGLRFLELAATLALPAVAHLDASRPSHVSLPIVRRA